MAIFTIEINGWGGEVVLGEVSKEAFEYWSDRDQDDDALNSHLFWDPNSNENGNEITDDDDPRFLGQWHEIDSIEHTCGAFEEMCHVVVKDEDGNDVWNTDEPEIESVEFADPQDQAAGYYFKGWVSEKGNFFCADIELDKFEPEKLKLYATDIDGDVMIDSVEYDGQILDNEGYDSRGKGSGWEFYEIF